MGSERPPTLRKRSVLIRVGLFIIVATILYLSAVPNFIGPKRSGPAWDRNRCINNLRQMDGAVQQWALEHQKKSEDKVSWNDITPYLKNPMLCPQKGKYTVGPLVSNVPGCSILGHTLPH
jgi:hypothetical protein